MPDYCLGSCSQEPTELERCIEANTGGFEYNYLEKEEEFVSKANATPDGEEKLKLYYEWQESITEYEERVITCGGNLPDEYFSENLDLTNPLDLEEYARRFRKGHESCFASVSSEMVEEATKICHAQGIY